MNVHKSTFDEVNRPGSIWAAVGMAKHEHRNMMRYKRSQEWSLQNYSMTQRNTMMQTIRLIARGLLTNVARHSRQNDQSVAVGRERPSAEAENSTPT